MKIESGKSQGVIGQNMRINITKQHIEEGKPRSSFKCAVAQAINAGLSGFHCVVKYDYIRIFDDDSQLIGKIPTPDNLISFMTAYDDKKHCSPFSFAIDLSENLCLTNS